MGLRELLDPPECPEASLLPDPTKPLLTIGIPAPLGRRLVSVLIDTVMAWMVILAIMVILASCAIIATALVQNLNQSQISYYSGKLGERMGAFVAEAMMNPFIYGLLAWAYYVPSWTFGWSVGKKSLGIVLVNEKGGRPGVKLAFLRYAVMAILAPIALMPWWPTFFRTDRRGIHDIISQTYVVSTK